MKQKYVYLFIGIVMFGMLPACQKNNKLGNMTTLITKDCLPERKDVAIIKNEAGTIVKVADLYLLISKDGNNRYIACNMPETMSIDGAKCIYSLMVKEIFPNERHIATPSYLTKLELLK
ncbi:MAG: hypothetical protein IPO92_09955 [Saprospiraceae bacterium]|nr:hypothetical protein [Saprospiraceae bacterium]